MSLGWNGRGRRANRKEDPHSSSAAGPWPDPRLLVRASSPLITTMRASIARSPNIRVINRRQCRFEGGARTAEKTHPAAGAKDAPRPMLGFRRLAHGSWRTED